MAGKCVGDFVGQRQCMDWGYEGISPEEEILQYELHNYIFKNVVANLKYDIIII